MEVKVNIHTIQYNEYGEKNDIKVEATGTLHQKNKHNLQEDNMKTFKHNTKKSLSLLLICLLTAALLLTGCGGSGDDANTGGADGENLKIGIMQFGEFTALQNATKGFIDGLADAGYVDGENITIHQLSAAAEAANCPSIADTLVNEKSDLILAVATPCASAIKEKTADIPVLFTAVTDPAGSGLVASNDAPGANLTGTSDMNPVSQQIALGKQLIPDAKKVAIMYCSSESNSKIQSDLAEAAIKEQGMESVVKTVSAIDEAKSAIESLKGQVDFIYIPTDNTLADGMTSVSAAANECGIPTIVGESGMVGNGAFATYGINYYELGKTTAAMAVKILKGEAEPASMPIEYQTDESVLEVAINTETADKLGITIPDEVKSTATLLP